MPPWWTTRYIDTETVAVIKASALTPAIRHASANVYLYEQCDVLLLKGISVGPAITQARRRKEDNHAKAHSYANLNHPQRPA